MYSSLINYEAYQQRYYGQLQAFPPFREMAPVVERFIGEIADEGEFCIRMGIDALEKVVASGSIMSMVETGCGTTNGGPEVRKQVVCTLFGCRQGDMQPQDYPKFGYLGPRKVISDYLANNGMDYQYGSVIVRLDKRRVGRRTSLCFGNSVSMGASNVMIPTMLDNVKATCMPGMPNGGGRSMLPLSNPWVYYIYFFTMISQGKLTVKNFHQVEMLTAAMPQPVEYFELQFHGPLSLRSDVKEIVVLAEPEERPRLEALRPALDAAAVPLTVLTTLFPDE